MKRFVLFFVIFLSINITVLSTLPPTEPKTYTEMFDSVFSVVSRVQATTGILYDRVVPFANLVNSTLDTSNYIHFIQAYSELYRAAFDSMTRLSLNVDDFEAQVKDTATPGVVDIGILHYNFNAIDYAVAMQKLIFVDSNLIGEDTTIAGSLYKEITAF
jgi:hypothetical protein